MKISTKRKWETRIVMGILIAILLLAICVFARSAHSQSVYHKQAEKICAENNSTLFAFGYQNKFFTCLEPYGRLRGYRYEE